jgi:thiol-disulfide isomerase/thioredoxin
MRTTILPKPCPTLEKPTLPAILALAALAFPVALATLAGCSREKTETPPPASGAPAPAAQPSTAAPPPSAGSGAQEAQPGASMVMRTDRIDFTQPLEPVNAPAPFSSYAGRKLLVFYFGPTCPHCQASLPEVQAYAESLVGEGYAAVAIANQRSDIQEIREFIAKYNCRLPVYWDKERSFGQSYGVQSLPTLFLVRPSAEYHRQVGFNGKPTLDSLRALD